MYQAFRVAFQQVLGARTSLAPRPSTFGRMTGLSHQRTKGVFQFSGRKNLGRNTPRKAYGVVALELRAPNP